MAFWRDGSVGDDLSQIFAIAKGAAPRPGRVMPVAAVTWGCTPVVASCFRRLGRIE